MPTLNADREVFELKRQMLFAAGPIAAKQHSYAATVFQFAFAILTADQLKLIAEFMEHIDSCSVEECE